MLHQKSELQREMERRQEAANKKREPAASQLAPMTPLEIQLHKQAGKLKEVSHREQVCQMSSGSSGVILEKKSRRKGQTLECVSLCSGRL